MTEISKLLILSLCLFGCMDKDENKVNLDKNVTLICRPTNAQENDKSEAITVFAHRDTMWFPSRAQFSNEYFLKEGRIFNNYCLVEGELRKNYCENAGFITFFNGSRLVISETELDCEIP